MVPLVACYEITGANLAIGFLVGLMTGRPALLPTGSIVARRLIRLVPSMGSGAPCRR